MPSTTWFLQMKRWCALPVVSTPVPKPETMKTMMNKSPKSWIICAVMPGFFSRSLCSIRSVPCDMATLNCSTLLHLAPLCYFWLSFAGTRLPSTPLFPQMPPAPSLLFSPMSWRQGCLVRTFSEPCLQAMSWRNWEGERQWQQKTGSTQLIPAIPPVKSETK